MSEATTTTETSSTNNAQRPPKRIVLCSDGTGNKGGTGRDTNVWRLFNYLDLSCTTNPHQVAFYDDGIGTQDFKLLKMLGGAFGYGVSRNICQLYGSLARNYRPGDEIYIFGFSRGAYTARVLAALICNCGVLRIEPGMSDKDIDRLVKRAMRHIRDSFDLPVLTRLWRLVSGPFRKRHADIDVNEFRRTVSHDSTNDPEGMGKLIKFIGVWDTVSAIGTPVFGLTTLINTLIYRIDFPDRALNHRVTRARHALAIDDERATFHPMLWDEVLTHQNIDKLNADRSDDAHVAEPDIQQVWFPGAHSNVGGGYPKQGLAYASLVWMMKSADLDYREGASEEAVSRINPTDKLYNSRSGLAAYYRYRPRDILKYARENTNSKILIDTTTIERVYRAVDAYAPGNIPFDASIVDTSGVRPQLVHSPMTSAAQIATDLGLTAKSMHIGLGGYVAARKILHGLMIVTTFLAIAVIYLPGEQLEDAGTLAKGLAFILPGSNEAHIQSVIISKPGLFYGFLSWVTLLFGLRHWLRTKTEGAYRSFWSRMRDQWLG